MSIMKKNKIGYKGDRVRKIGNGALFYFKCLKIISLRRWRLSRDKMEWEMSVHNCERKASW